MDFRTSRRWLYKIVSKLSGRCLDVVGMSMEDGAGIQIWDYMGGDNQQWRIVDPTVPAAEKPVKKAAAPSAKKSAAKTTGKPAAKTTKAASKPAAEKSAKPAKTQTKTTAAKTAKQRLKRLRRILRRPAAKRKANEFKSADQYMARGFFWYRYGCLRLPLRFRQIRCKSDKVYLTT